MQTLRLAMNSLEQTATTNGCKRFGHPEFKIRYSSDFVPEPDIRWLLSFLESEASKGAKYTPGQTIQIGWMILHVEAAENGMLKLMEPDMIQTPIRFVDSVVRTLRHLREQTSALESLGFETNVTFPTILQSGIKCSRHDDSAEVFLHRLEPDNHDSGWFFGCLDRNHDHHDVKDLIRVSLYEVASTREEIVPFLALPPDTMVLLRKSRVDIVFKGERMRIKPESFLAQRYPAK